MLLDVGRCRRGHTAIATQSKTQMVHLGSQDHPRPLPSRPEMLRAKSASLPICSGFNQVSPSPGQRKGQLDHPYHHESYGTDRRLAWRSAVMAPASASAAALCSSPSVTEWMFRLGTLYALPFCLLVRLIHVPSWVLLCVVDSAVQQWPQQQSVREPRV